jgi:hypothetical protein
VTCLCVQVQENIDGKLNIEWYVERSVRLNIECCLEQSVQLICRHVCKFLCIYKIVKISIKFHIFKTYKDKLVLTELANAKKAVRNEKTCLFLLFCIICAQGISTTRFAVGVNDIT